MRSAPTLLALLALCACGSLPHDGPSQQSISREAKHDQANYAVVDLDYGVTQTIAAHPPASLIGLANESSVAPTDLIGAGDQVALSVFEAGGGGLFQRSMTPDIDAESSDMGASLESSSAGASPMLPKLVVDSDGDVAVPFAGSVHVAGLRPAQAAEVIRRALRGRAVDPQVTVTVLQSHANAVTVIGEVQHAGHFPLSAHNDRLIDALAAAGGPTKPVADLSVAVYRGALHAEAPLSLVMSDSAQNIRLAPEDQVRILDRPKKYNVFGAFGKVDQNLIEYDNPTLADAISHAGGLDTYSAASASVLVFRFERPEVAAALGVTIPSAAKGVPIIYRLNFRKPDRLFVANNFDIQSDDLLYVPRSDITEAMKFFNLVDSVTQIGYNARVSTAAVP